MTDLDKDSTNQNSGNSETPTIEKKYSGFWPKLKKAGIFFAMGPLYSVFLVAKSLITGDRSETVRSAIEGGALIVEGVGFGSFIKKIRDNKIFQKISNAIEFIFPKPVRTIIAIGCGVSSVVLAGTWIAVASLAITCLCKAYTTYIDINDYKKLRSRIQEYGLATKQGMVGAEIIEQIKLLKKNNPNIDIEKIVNEKNKSISNSSNNNSIIQDKSEKKIPGINIILPFAENLGTFSTSISAGIAMTAIRTIGATSYSEIKNKEMNQELKRKLNLLKEKILPYKNIKDLTEQTNDQIFLCETLDSLRKDQAFLDIKDDKMAFKILDAKFEEIKESNKPVVRVPKLVSTWEAFKETQSSSTNYGNLTNTDYILQEERNLSDFKKELITIDSQIKQEERLKNIGSSIIGLEFESKESIPSKKPLSKDKSFNHTI